MADIPTARGQSRGRAAASPGSALTGRDTASGRTPDVWTLRLQANSMTTPVYQGFAENGLLFYPTNCALGRKPNAIRPFSCQPFSGWGSSFHCHLESTGRLG
jgi:hypothetical protein